MDCLVTKFKAEADNDSLPYFNSIIVYAAPGEGRYYRIGADSANTCLATYVTNEGNQIKTAITGNYASSAYIPLDPGNQETYWGINTIVAVGTSGLIKISNKYNLTTIPNLAKTDLSELSKCTKIKSLTISSESTNMDNAVTGDISELSELTLLRSLNLNATISKVTGSVESLVEGLVSNGIEDCTIRLYNSGKTTINGRTPLKTRLFKLIFSSGTCDIYQDASTSASGTDEFICNYDGSTWTYA